MPPESAKQPVSRLHVVRDQARIAQFKHKIRKVTGDDAGGVSASETVAVEREGKTRFNAHFQKLHIMGPLLRTIESLGWQSPTPVQAGTIALGIRGLNIVASAETGTGKTAAYAIPMIQRIYVRKKYEELRGIQRVAAPLGVILCPTRELAEQVEDQVFALAKDVPGMRILGLSGALKDPSVQIRELQKGVDILVATPGRLLRLLNEEVTREDDLEDAAAIPELGSGEGEVAPGEDGEALAEVFADEEEEAWDEEEAMEMDETGEEYDDGFGEALDEDFDLEEVSVSRSEEINDEKMLHRMMSPSRVAKRRKQKRDAVYSQWDRSWQEMEDVGVHKSARFKERLPFIPHGQAVKNANIDLTHVRHLALDEVDRMLAMGMFPEVRHLFKAMPRPQGRKDPERMQIFMFTATLVPRVWELIKRFAPHHIRVDLNKAMNVAERVKQHFYEVGSRRKYALLTYLLRRKGSMKGQQVLVFCRTRQRVERLAQQLIDEGFPAAGIHGNQTLSQRQRIIDQFREGNTQILVSTEIMARGMDIPELPFVVNYDLPHSPEEYVHRIGRTARAGHTGTAFSFVASEPSMVEVGKRLVELDERFYMQSISKFLQKNLVPTKVPGPWKDEAKQSTESGHVSRSHQRSSSTSSPSSSAAAATTTTSASLPYAKSPKRPTKKDANKGQVSVPATPVLDVRTKSILKADQLKTKPSTNYYYLEDDPELKSVIPPERDLVDKAQQVLSRLYDRKSRQVEHASKTRTGLAHVKDATAVLQHQVSLRDFQEGRYEDVMEEFDTRRARKLGVAVPKNLDSVLLKKREKIQKKHERKLAEQKKREML